MGVLRFPNPGSDIPKFISTFSLIYNELNSKTNFTHDDTRDAVVKWGMASSSGAIGQEAINRSINKNRSLDPLYNQLKMYSELYRMLGWLKPGTMNTNFNFTELSSYVAESSEELQLRIFEECLLSIVFPNPLVENRSNTILRPFPLILKLARQLDGIIFRDEIIISILTLPSDTSKETLNRLVSQIKGLRGDSKKLLAAKAVLSADIGIQTTTLENYTRFPLGSIKDVKWFSSGSDRSAYEKPTQGYSLTETGIEKINWLKKRIDIRHSDIALFPLDKRAAFTLLTHYLFLERCGFTSPPISIIDDLKTKTKSILEALKIELLEQIFYSPIQQAAADEIKLANDLDNLYY